MNTMAAVIAYLDLLEGGWDDMSDDERREAVRLALEAARRAADDIPE